MSFVRTYNPAVRVANWNEDIALEQDKVKEFLRRKEGGDLTLSRTQTLLAQNSAPSTTSPLQHDGNVYVGQHVVLRHLASEAALSALPSVYTPRDDGFIGVSAAPKAHPSARNVLEVVPHDPSETGVLKYGQKFHLKMTAPDGSASYLYTERISLFGGNAKYSTTQQGVLLRPSATGPGPYGTVWQVLCYDPQYRLEAEGHPVPANCPIIIASAATNQDLAVIRQHFVRSEYGVEYETTCHTHLNPHKAEGPENHWAFEL